MKPSFSYQHWNKIKTRYMEGGGPFCFVFPLETSYGRTETEQSECSRLIETIRLLRGGRAQWSTLVSLYRDIRSNRTAGLDQGRERRNDFQAILILIFIFSLFLFLWQDKKQKQEKSLQPSNWLAIPNPVAPPPLTTPLTNGLLRL